MRRYEGGDFPDYTQLKDQEDTHVVKRNFQKGINLQCVDQRGPYIFDICFNLSAGQPRYFAEWFNEYRITGIELFLTPRTNGYQFNPSNTPSTVGPSGFYECTWDGQTPITTIQAVMDNDGTHQSNCTGGWFYKLIDNPVSYKNTTANQLPVRMPSGQWYNTEHTRGLYIQHYGAKIAFDREFGNNLDTPNLGLKGCAVLHCEFRGRKGNQSNIAPAANPGPDGMAYWNTYYGGNQLGLISNATY